MPIKIVDTASQIIADEMHPKLPHNLSPAKGLIKWWNKKSLQLDIEEKTKHSSRCKELFAILLTQSN